MAQLNMFLDDVKTDNNRTTPQHDNLMIKLDNIINERFNLIYKDILDVPALSALGASMRDSKTIWEHPIEVIKYSRYGDRSSYILGYADLVFTYEYYDSKNEHFIDNVYFEVKPTIPSCGDLIRQIRKYQTVTNSSKWFVFSPDTKFKDVILKQGIGFINPDDYSI